MPSRLSIHLDEMFWMPKLSSFLKKKKIFFLHIWNIPSLHSSKLWERLKSDQQVLLYGLEIVQRNVGQTICSLGFAPLLPPPLWFPPSWMLLGKWSGTWHFLFLKWTKTSDGRTNPPVSCSSSFCSVEEGFGGGDTLHVPNFHGQGTDSKSFSKNVSLVQESKRWVIFPSSLKWWGKSGVPLGIRCPPHKGALSRASCLLLELGRGCRGFHASVSKGLKTYSVSFGEAFFLFFPPAFPPFSELWKILTLLSCWWIAWGLFDLVLPTHLPVIWR